MKFHLTIIFLLITSFLFAQVNLVPNPSFEIYDTCPNGTNQVYRATGWDIDINSSDYYNSCATYSSMVAVPNAGAGYQCPATGNAFCGFYAFAEQQLPRQYREYFGRALSNPLTVGQKYFISLKLILAEDISPCAVNKLGVKFTNINYGDTSFYEAPVMNNTTHFYTNVIISDTSNWTTITGTYIADSSYQYILIGNFFDDSHTDTSYISGPYCASYYFIDDICVSVDSLTCIIPNGQNICDSGAYIFETNHSKESISIYPNPATNELTIDCALTDKSYFELYDVIGAKRKVVTLDCGSQTKKIDLTDIDSGIYFYSVVDRKGNRIKTGKLVVIK